MYALERPSEHKWTYRCALSKAMKEAEDTARQRPGEGSFRRTHTKQWEVGMLLSF